MLRNSNREDFQRNNVFLQYDKGLAKNPCPWGHLVYRILVSITIYPYPGVKMTICFGKIHFHYMISNF